MACQEFSTALLRVRVSAGRLRARLARPAIVIPHLPTFLIANSGIS
jgi:hypothetical protein